MVSAVILTKNEEKNIEACLKQLAWCDEVVVIDDYSGDDTAKKAKKLGGRVFRRYLREDFAAQRNFAFKKAKGEWVLYVDADERISPALRDEILSVTGDIACPFNGFYVKRKDFLWGKALNYGETAYVRLLRLGIKGKGKWKRRVHETWEIKGKIGNLNNPLLHYPHENVAQFLETINFYTSIHAQILADEGVTTNFWQILAYPVAKFIRNYVVFLGIFDGMPGFIHATLMSFHSFLTRGKLWLLKENKAKRGKRK